MCGAWAMAELQRLCHMANAPPTGGEWRAWYARLCKLIEPYHDRQDDAGRCARRLLREMISLWVLLTQCGVEATNNRGDGPCALGCSGASALTGQRVPRATAGSNGSCLSKKPVVSKPDLPTPCWLTLSHVSSMVNSLISPGSRRVRTSSHPPVIVYSGTLQACTASQWRGSAPRVLLCSGDRRRC